MLGMTLYSSETKVADIVALLNAQTIENDPPEEAWTYRVATRGKFFAVAVYDETDFFLGYL